jgi:hypothetical protein
VRWLLYGKKWINQEKMKIKHQIDQIINENVTAISTGEESLESVLARYPQITNELRPRLEAAIWLQQVRLSVATRPGFIFDSRKYLEAKIESMHPTGFWERVIRRYTPQRWFFNVTAPLIMLLLLALVINSAILTARLSIPGDPLYSTKLAIEGLQIAMTFDSVDKTELYIQFSRQRTTEFVELVLEGEYELLPSAADRMETELIASLHSLNHTLADDPDAELSMVATYRDSLSSEILMLNVLKDTSPISAQSGIDLAIQIAQSGMMALR